MKKLYFLFLFAVSVNAETLITPSYEIEIGSCPEGHVSCDTISFVVKNIESGSESSYVGGTLHTLCADGETPCRFLGYQFTSKIGQFNIYDTGTLVINDADGQAVLIEEGSWSE
jgi:hypothetical protein